jgi:hypothetical protein
MAMANYTRLPPSQILGRRNNVRGCCLTVRGLMLSGPNLFVTVTLREQVQDWLLPRV